MVNVALANIRAAAEDASNAVFSAERNVLLEISTAVAPTGWLSVKHRDGQAGFVKVTEVWGE